MKNYLKTAIKLIQNIKTTGAISEFSRFVEKEITKNVCIEQKQIIIEFGGGHGNVTRAILSRMNSASKLFTFEIHPDFIPILNEIQDPRLHIIHDSATQILHYVQENTVNCIISTLPLTIMDKDVYHNILSNAQKALIENETFSQALYSIRKEDIMDYFYNCNISPTLNFPFAFIHHCKK